SEGRHYRHGPGGIVVARTEFAATCGLPRRNPAELAHDVPMCVDAGAASSDGRGGFRTCDLSRVKRDRDSGDGRYRSDALVLICREFLLCAAARPLRLRTAMAG